MIKKIPFDISYLDKIKNGEIKVVTLDDRPVTIVNCELKGNYPILGYTTVEVCNYEGDESWLEERPFAYSKNGQPCRGVPNDKNRLFILIDVEEETLEEAAENWSNDEENTRGCDYVGAYTVKEAFKSGANWQKEQDMKKFKDILRKVNIDADDCFEQMNDCYDTL